MKKGKNKQSRETITVSGKEALEKIIEIYHDESVYSAELTSGGKLLAKIHPGMTEKDLNYVLMSTKFYLSTSSPSIEIHIERGDLKKRTSKSDETDKYLEKIALKGVRHDPAAAAIEERKYMEKHPCGCGGRWDRIKGGISLPIAYSICRCSRCGREKKFQFYLG